MKYSIVDYKKIDLENRIDAEYFEPEYLKIENRLKKKNISPLSDLCRLTSSAFYPAATELYSSGDLPFIRCVDCIDNVVITSLQDEKFAKIPQSFANEYNNIKKLKREDIVITKVGSPCFASIIYDIDKVALSRTVLGVTKIQNIDPYYLTVFLRSKFGFEQLYRERELTIQYQLTLERVGNVLVYKPLKKAFELLIAKLLKLNLEKNRMAVNAYFQAEQILLSELNLLNWEPKHRPSFIRNYSETQSADRIDPEYFQPMYEEIVKAISSSKNYSSLDELISIKKCVEPGSEAYQDNGVMFLRVSNLSKFGFKYGNQKYVPEDLYRLKKQHQPKQGEILLSKDATPGIAYYLKDVPEKMIPSGGILRITIKDNDKISPEYLTLILNSVIVQKQIERDVGGSIINHWLVDQVKNTLIPILSVAKQKEIVETVNNSFFNRELSKQLLNISKRGVELAIEKDESYAQKWIEKEVKRLGVNFYNV